MKTEKHYRYIEKIRQIDETLCPPVESLFKLAARRAPSNDRLAQRLTSEGNKRPVFFPPWVSEYNTYPSEGVYLLTRASCCSALLRIWRIRRRFPDLKKALEERSYLEESSDLKNLIEDTFVPPSDEKKKNFVECAFRLHSGTSGTLNPLTASQVLSVLMDAGERRAHSGIGFLAFFGMAWSLHRRFPDSAAQGAYLGPWNPTAYVTAKCLIPIRSLYSVCKLRAELFEKIQEAVKELDELAKQDCDPCSFWRFTAKLDQLSDRLSEMGQIAIHREALQNCEKEVSALAGRHGPQINAKTPLKDLNDVTKLLAEMLREICKKTKEVADEAQPVVDGAKDLIVAKLKDSSSQWDGKLGEDLRVQLGREWIDPKYDGKYVSDLYEAAKKAHEECERALKILTDSSQDCADMLKVNQGDEALHSVQSAFSCLATANKKLANLFDETFRNNARWCRAVVDREIAHISAKNYTDFDPAELASGIAVAVRWEEMNSSLEVRDAIAKALVGAHPDGSWKPGQPFYTTGRGLAVIPITSDIIWTLATAVAQYPEIAVADRVFERYVDWLSRTRTQAPFPPSNSEQSERINVIGWPSDRARESRNVDLWATALAIHALLEIRDLFEYRLWQICNERFTVVQPKQRLGQLAPVDLGAKHEARIQRKLAQFSRRARQAYDDADYALVLHGPPGSSKTSIAEALAAEMWGAPAGASRQRSRLIRITPADFTRRGEERLDYEARVIFELLQSVRGVTVLFDEIDDLLRRRQPGTEPSFIKLVVPAMLNRLQDLRVACPRQEICILFATNYIEQIEPALMRKGRIDECIPIVYPDPDSRRAIVCGHIGAQAKAEGDSREVDQDGNGTKVLANHLDVIVNRTDGWPWKTLDELCRRVVDRTKQRGFKESDGTEANQNIEELISEFQASLTDPDYEQRLKNPKLSSSHLRNEVLHYCFAYASLPDKYVHRLGTLDTDLVEEGLRLWARSGRQERRGTPRPRLVA